MLVKKRKKGQAAVEFLTTYGWAIMGVILTIGALSYFDFLNTQRYVSENCNTGAQIQCLEAYAEEGGVYRINLRNNYPVDIVIDNIIILAGGVEYPFDTSTSITRGESKIIGSTNQLPNSILAPGTKQNLDLRIEFSRSGGTNKYNVTGTSTIKVQSAGLCGNGNVDPGEDCDGSVSQTCQGLGYASGVLICSSSCSYDESGCTMAEGNLPLGSACSTGSICGSGLCVKTVATSPQGTCVGSCENYVYFTSEFPNGQICSSGPESITQGGICIASDTSEDYSCQRYNVGYNSGNNWFDLCLVDQSTDGYDCDDDAANGFIQEGRCDADRCI